MGALPGTDTDQQQFLDQEWEKRTANGRHWLGVKATDETTSMQEVVFLEKGIDFIDEHHLYLVDRDDTCGGAGQYQIMQNRRFRFS